MQKKLQIKAFKYDKNSNLTFYNLELEELLEDVIEASQTAGDMRTC